jgi:hypothetical protein
MARTGTNDIQSLLANNTSLQSIAGFGLDNLADIITQDLDAWNATINDAVGEIAEVSTDRLRASGNPEGMVMYEVDEYGRAPDQKITAGYNLGFPLRKRQIAIGWTREWFRMHTVRDMLLATQAAEKAHRLMLYRDLRRSLYLSANYTFTDLYQAPSVTLPVKRLLNADSLGIPTGPNSEFFDPATHTHYLGSATLTAAALLSTVNTVLEHRITAGIRIVIAQTDRAAVEALAGYKAYPDPRVQFMNTDQNRQTIDLTRMNNLAIGTFGAAEVWVKPWAIANYALAYDADGPKPVVFRQLEGNLAGLQIEADNDAFPLHSQFMGAKYGFGVWTRWAAAILNFSNASYTDPVIT